METLRELSMAAVVKFGVHPRMDLPDGLPTELVAKENEIQWYLTGRFHSHGGVLGFDDIEMFWDWRKDWDSGEEWREWRFVMHGQTTDKTTIRAGRRNHLHTSLAKLFLLSPAIDISVDDFKMDLRGRTVTFYGSHTPAKEENPPVTNSFIAIFKFVPFFGGLIIESEMKKRKDTLKSSKEYIEVTHDNVDWCLYCD